MKFWIEDIGTLEAIILVILVRELIAVLRSSLDGRLDEGLISQSLLVPIRRTEVAKKRMIPYVSGIH